MAGNYFGDGGDGNVTISSDTQLTVPNKVGNYDGDMVVKNYNNLTINEGFTLTTDQPARGMLIYVKNDLVVNGTLSMTARGAYANPETNGGSDNSAVSAGGLRLPVFTSGGSDTLAAADFAGCGSTAVAYMANQPAISGNGTIFTLVRQGAAGGAGYSGGTEGCHPGTSGGVGQTGGGASGGVYGGASSGSGSYGSCFGGGPGGGGGASWNGLSGSAWGGKGGDGRADGGSASPGAGNPGGDVVTATHGNSSGPAENGTGGLLILIVKGTIYVGSNGAITANGKNGRTDTNAHGGGSGGGNILALYGSTYENNGTVQAIGGNSAGAGSVQASLIDQSFIISGQISANSRIFTFDESNWTMLTNDTVSTGDYEVSTTISSKVMVVSRNDTTGELLGYGDISPQQ